MDETEYHKIATPPLEELLEFIEKLEESHDIEVEFEEGVLTITMPDERVYVINKHTPSREIWVSSPYSGAGYFEFQSGEWLPRRANAAQGKNLQAFIREEVTARLD